MEVTGDIPDSQTAIIQHDDGVLKVTHGLPIPELSSHHLLVSTKAVALNPCDFKMPLRFPTPGLWNGCDFAGIVVALGSQVAADGRFHLGDHVFGAVQGSNQSDPQSGAYCQYIRVDADFTNGNRNPRGALFWSLQLPGKLDDPACEGENVLVYGGSSTIGLLAIQMVKLCGHRVITTCSPHNFDLVRQYGADLVFDYKSPTCAKDIRDASKNTLRYVLDPFSEVKTLRICQEAMGRTGGRYCALEQYQDDLFTRKTIKHELVMGGAISGEGVKLPEPYGIPPRPEIGEWARGWYQSVQQLITAGKLSPAPVEIIPGRFEGVLGGLDTLKAGKVSGKKLIVAI
ncbi:Polyketide synthaseenoylreductase [Penicillium lividum]|nr:Polyketide synthaseenoylreductase [Penicillium lividum]